jgi:lipopolysaccharide/colanic/teichoic acid biosynthesis glycosyltransferase
MKTMRFLEILLGIVGLLVFGPIMLIVAILIYLEDKGEILFRQERLGKNRKTFRIYKFRSMKNNQVTRVGYYLRKTGLDELPQFWNVLIGDMAIVGPRPLTSFDVNRLGWNKEKYSIRWNVKPGLTGLAQIYAGRSARISFSLDSNYIKNTSFYMDIKIILVSFMMNVFGKYGIRKYLNEKLKERKEKSWRYWYLHFEKNSKRNYPNPFKEELPVRPEARDAIIRSLCIFQLGESGEGLIAKEIEKVIIKGINNNYRKSLKLFVKEEGRHARLLALCIQALGGKLISTNWTEKLFHVARRLMGVRLKLVVLLAAEIVGISFYRVISEKMPEGKLRNILSEICSDEEFHLLFHTEFFKRTLKSKIAKMTFVVVWKVVVLCSSVCVILDHLDTLQKLNISYFAIFHKFMEVSEKVVQIIQGEETRQAEIIPGYLQKVG